MKSILILLSFLVCSCEQRDDSRNLIFSIFSVRAELPSADTTNYVESPVIGLTFKIKNVSKKRWVFDMKSSCNNSNSVMYLKSQDKSICFPLVAFNCRPIIIEPDSSYYPVFITDNHFLLKNYKFEEIFYKKLLGLENSCLVTYIPRDSLKFIKNHTFNRKFTLKYSAGK